MIYRNIPSFEKPLSAITFGGASLSGEGGGYGFGSMSDSQAETLIKGAWEAGITVYDTAPIYGFGLSEERLGRYLPQEAILISKSGVDWHSSKRVNMTNDPVVTEKMLHQSLRRLNRDNIDLYMIHWPDAKVDIRLPLEVLAKAQKEGKIKEVGLCNTNQEDLRKAKEILPVIAIQSELNLFNQDSFLNLDNSWKEIFSMGWGTFDKGILSGRVFPERRYEKEDARSWAPWWNKKEVQRKIDRTTELKNILLDYGISLPHFCVQYSISYFGISSCLVGFKTVGDIVDVTFSLQRNLMRERIEEVLDRWKNRPEP